MRQRYRLPLPMGMWFYAPLEAILMMLQFHLPCVNVAKPLPPTWYCDDCSKKLGLDNNGTSGNGATGSERGRKRRTR